MEDSVALAGKLGITFPLLKDEGLKTSMAYGVAMNGEDISVPSVFIVNTKKQIVFREVSESIMSRPSADSILEAAEAAK